VRWNLKEIGGKPPVRWRER